MGHIKTKMGYSRVRLAEGEANGPLRALDSAKTSPSFSPKVEASSYQFASLREDSKDFESKPSSKSPQLAPRVDSEKTLQPPPSEHTKTMIRPLAQANTQAGHLY